MRVTPLWSTSAPVRHREAIVGNAALPFGFYRAISRGHVEAQGGRAPSDPDAALEDVRAYLKTR
jgi:hypothetical protein